MEQKGFFKKKDYWADQTFIVAIVHRPASGYVYNCCLVFKCVLKYVRSCFVQKVFIYLYNFSCTFEFLSPFDRNILAVQASEEKHHHMTGKKKLKRLNICF